MPAKSLREFIAHAKANPGKISFGSSGVGASPHLSIELLKLMTGINIVHVPYKGAAAALTDVMGGQIPASETAKWEKVVKEANLGPDEGRRKAKGARRKTKGAISSRQARGDGEPPTARGRAVSPV